VAAVTGKTAKKIIVRGRTIALSIRRSPRARRLALRVDSTIGGAELILPKSASESDGLKFVTQRGAWLLDKLDQLPPRTPFHDGAVLPVGGVDCVIKHAPGAVRSVKLEGDALLVGGASEHVARRVRDWLRREARGAITPLAWEKAQIISLKPGRISIRDQRSRWGSCSHKGGLSFNWRLILAPPMVLDYVVAHEAAHLREMNHSPAFWTVVDQLTDHANAGRHWLKLNGARLHAYG
jgi:predicted metal-dependent hydrolase